MSAENNIEIIARGVLVSKGKLLVCRSRGAGNIYLPGGHIELNEDGKRALVREISEEMGCSARAGEFIGVVEHSFIQSGLRHCEINLIFTMEIEGTSTESNPPSLEDYIEFFWLDLNELAGSTLEPYPVRTKIAEWLASSREPERWASTHV